VHALDQKEYDGQRNEIARAERLTREMSKVNAKVRSVTCNQWGRSSCPHLLRLSGLAALLAGVLFAAWGYLHRGAAPARVDTIVGTLGLIVPPLFSVGLSGFYAWRWGRTVQRLGLTGLVFSYIATALEILYRLLEVSGTADAADRYAYLAGRGWTPQYFDWLPWLFAGLVLVGIASMWTGPVRGWNLLPLAMGLFGWAYYLSDSGGMIQMRIAHILFGTLFGLSWIVLGYLLWSDRTKTMQRFEGGKPVSG
jgi:hypothetical protein